MASQIITWGLDGDKGVELINSHFARTFAIDNTWTNLRVGCRLSFKESASYTFTGTTTFFMGLCHGTSSVFGDSYVSNSIGMISVTNGWPSDAGNGYVTVNRWIIGVASGSNNVVTYGNTSGKASVTASCRDPFMIDFSRTASATGSIINCSLFTHYYGGLTDCNQSTFYQLLEQSTPSFGNNYYYSVVASPIIYENTNGILDSVCVSWNRTYPSAVINDIAVYRLA